MFSPESLESLQSDMLSASEPWLGMALKQAQAGAWKWDLVRGNVQFSTELYELLRIDLAEDVSDPHAFFEMIHPDHRRTTTHKVEESVQRGGPFCLEFRFIRGDGKTIWLSSVGTVEHDSSGRPIQAAGINQDITARKLAEEALRESEERERARAAELEALMDAVPAMIWISRDPQCKEMVGNRYGYEFLRMWEGANISKTAPNVDIDQQPYRNFKNGQEIPGDELPMQIAASTGLGTNDYEFDLVFKDGVIKNLLGNVIPIFDQRGRPAGAVAAFVDITERKRVEDELRMSEAQLRKWKEYISFWNKATNSFFWVLGPDGSYRDPLLTDPGISGKPFDQTRGREWMKIIHPEDRERTRNDWQRAIEGQDPIEIESRVWHEATQQYRWFSHRAVPIIQDGTLEGWIGASMDIQVRKEIEQVLKVREIELLKSEHRFRVALASAPITVFTMDKELRYTWIYSPRHQKGEVLLLGKRDDEIIDPENVAELIDAKRSVIVTGQAVQQEIKIRINDAWFFYLITLDPILDRRCQVTGLVGAAFDITEQRELEAVQRENEIQMATQHRLLETRENERVKIARDLHDGPIQTLVGTIFDIHHLKEAAADPAMKVDLEPIGVSLKYAIQELRQIVNELRPPTLVHFGLVKAIQEHAGDTRKKFPRLGLTLELAEDVVDLSEQINLTLYRIYQEAIQNVIRHSEATKAAIRLSLDEGRVTIEIEDNGIGFAVPNEFSGLTQEGHFGMAGMRERAETVGGIFQVWSKPGQGSIVKVTVPVSIEKHRDGLGGKEVLAPDVAV